MTPGFISKRVVADRLGIARDLLAEIRALPLDDREEFFADRRNQWTTESCLRRALEAVLDVGRHILAKGFGEGVSEYKEIATGLGRHDVLSGDDAALMRTLAGYRNRMVHFYHEVSADELFGICGEQLCDLDHLLDVLATWVRDNSEQVDPKL
jgi:uncharacterized protein YutE (UPF0331/DUF86 family)